MQISRKNFVLTSFIGAAVGIVSGGLVWLTTPVSLLTAVGFCMIIGISLPAAPLLLMNSESYNKPESSKHVRRDAAPAGLATGLSIALLYKLVTDRSSLVQMLIVCIIAGALTWLLTVRWLEHRTHRTPNSRQLSVKINKDNNFMGKDVEKVLYLLADNETRVDFAEKPPLIEGVIVAGLPIELTAIATWGLLGFKGFGLMFTAAISGNAVIGGLSVASISLLLLWALQSLREKPPKSRNLKDELLVVCAAIGLWWALQFPLASWLFGQLHSHPSRLWLAVSVPCAVWTVLRWSSYRKGVRLLTNADFHVGTTGLLLPEDSISTMPRIKMTNYSLKQGLFRWLLGYYVLKSEGQGQDDQEFQKIRVSHGEQLNKLLPNPADS